MNNLAQNIQTQAPEYNIQQLEMFNPYHKSIYVKFLAFHTQHPQVYILFDRFAKQLIEKGHKKLGSKMIMERIRWEISTGSKDQDGFKINNNYTAHYSRLFIKNNPQYREYFDFREIRAL